jgi:hypothetical protein
MAVKLKLNNAEVPELCKYISQAKLFHAQYDGDNKYIAQYLHLYDGDNKSIAAMVQHLVFEVYRSLGNRYMHDDKKPSYTLTLTRADAAAFMMYYSACPLPDNKYSKAIVQGIFNNIDKQLQ